MNTLLFLNYFGSISTFEQELWDYLLIILYHFAYNPSLKFWVSIVLIQNNLSIFIFSIQTPLSLWRFWLVCWHFYINIIHIIVVVCSVCFLSFVVVCHILSLLFLFFAGGKTRIVSSWWFLVQNISMDPQFNFFFLMIICEPQNAHKFELKAVFRESRYHPQRLRKNFSLHYMAT